MVIVVVGVSSSGLKCRRIRNAALFLFPRLFSFDRFEPVVICPFLRRAGASGCLIGKASPFLTKNHPKGLSGDKFGKKSSRLVQSK